MVKQVEAGTPCVLYVRLSRNDPKSLSIDNQIAALRAYAPNAPVVIDKGVSGEKNLIDPDSNWSKQVVPLLRKNPKTRVVVFTLDRLGRKKGIMIYTAETILDGGGSIYCVREDRLFTDMDSTLEGFELMIGSYQADSYRVETTKKTKVALDVLSEFEIPVGHKPELTEADLREIRALRAKKLGYTAIGRMMSVKRMRDGKPVDVPRSARLIKKALSGDYESLEAYDRRSRQRREEMKARAVLGYDSKEAANG